MASQKLAVELDPILAELGAFGKYNIVNYAFLLFPVFLAGIYGSIYIFEAPDISYRCHVSECAHIENTSLWLSNAIPQVKGVPSKCTRYPLNRTLTDDDVTCSEDQFDTTKEEKCSSYDYSDEYSVVKDFNLGCQNWKRTLVGTVHNAGLFISLPLTGILSDKYGRKTALAVASLMNGIFGLLRSFSVNYEMLLAFEFLETALGAGAYSSAFVLAVELVGPKGRVFGNTILNIVSVCGLMTLSALSWKLQDWRSLLRIVYTPALLAFSYLWILNESVRWLISKGKSDEAVLILKKAAKMNKVQISEELLTPLMEKVTLVDEEKKDDAVKPLSTFALTIKSSIIRKRVVVCSFLWITCTFVYYGLSINSVSLAGNKYLNFMLAGFVEIPANFVCLFVLDRYGRKKTLIITYVLSACLCISLSFLPKDAKWWSLVVYLSGKFSITIAYSSVYIYVSEVFPTSMRQSLLAVCSCIGRVGSTLAPLTPLLFNLGCQNWKRTLVGTVHNAGLFISLPLTGILSDKYGRKTALAVASLMNGIFGLLRSFSVNYEMLLVFEFLETALGAGAYSTAFVLAVELVGPKGRVFGNTIINTVYVCGLMTLSALSWKLQDWRSLLRIVYTPALLAFSYLWILNESVRWLISKGKSDEAVLILKKAAKMNKVQISEELLTPLMEKVTLVDEEKKDDAVKPLSTFAQTITSSIIRKRVVVCSFLWITCTFVYYGLSINSVSLAGNKYLNFMLVGFVEIPANFVCLFVLDRYGRKRTLIITYVLSACLCISLSFLPKDAKWWSLVVYLSGKFSITIAYSSVYIYVSEVFPTSMRQSLLAACSSVGRVGSTLAPLTPLLALYYDSLPSIFFGSLALAASLLVFTLPETINLPLPDTIEDAEKLSRRRDKDEEDAVYIVVA